MDCPWDGFDPAVLEFCEAMVCGWIRQPANTWSNLAYVIAGIVVLRHRDEKVPAAVKSIGVAAILVGIMSFVYHASMTFFGEVLDFGSMFLFSSTLVTLNLLRLRLIRSEHWLRLHLSLILFSLAMLVFFRTIGKEIFGIQIAAAILMEAYMFKTSKQKIVYLPYMLGIGFFFLSYAAWLLDYHKIVCDPHNHWLQGHAAWHILNSTAFVFAYRFYVQFTLWQKLPEPGSAAKPS